MGRPWLDGTLQPAAHRTQPARVRVIAGDFQHELRNPAGHLPNQACDVLDAFQDLDAAREQGGRNGRDLGLIGGRWDRPTRERNLQRLTNNTRFLIPAWIEVPHLASHVLGLIARRIRADWQAKYGHPVHALETFVDRRFRGTCYRAANWLRLGQTRGRTRNDRHKRIHVPIKDVYLYPLVEDFREALRDDHV